MTEKAKKFVKESNIKVGKYNVGLPLISDSYKKQTPHVVKTIGEVCIFVGSFVTIIAASFTPPAWVIAAGGICTLAGRFVAKCFSEDKKD